MALRCPPDITEAILRRAGEGETDEVQAAEDGLAVAPAKFWSDLNPYDAFRLVLASGSLRGFPSACLGSGRGSRPQCLGTP